MKVKIQLNSSLVDCASTLTSASTCPFQKINAFIQSYEFLYSDVVSVKVKIQLNSIINNCASTSTSTCAVWLGLVKVDNKYNIKMCLAEVEKKYNIKIFLAEVKKKYNIKIFLACLNVVLVLVLGMDKIV